eukprot:gene22123-30358_t
MNNMKEEFIISDAIDSKIEEDKLFNCIERGKLYDLNYNLSSLPYLTLGFNFKPTNILSQTGKYSATLEISDTCEATVVYQGQGNGNRPDLLNVLDGNGSNNTADGNEKPVIFKGTTGIETVSGSNVDEYLLAFHEGAFTLSRVHTSVRNLRPIRGDEITSKAAVDVEQSKRVIDSALKKLKKRKRKAVELVPATSTIEPNSNDAPATSTAETSLDVSISIDDKNKK